MTINVVDAGSAKISRSAEVAAPAAEIFEIVADPKRHSELDGSGTVVGAVTGPDRLALGSRFSVNMKQYGLKWFGSLKHNEAGIEATLRQLQEKFG